MHILKIWPRVALGGSVICGVTYTGACAPAVAAADRGDTKVVLKIGPYELSRYDLELNLKRFIDPRGRKHPPSPVALQKWMESFLVRQVVIAKAISEGYAKRPAVAAEVQAMERHMLTQADGPLYKALAARHPLTPKRIRQLYAATALVPLVAGARLPAEYTKELESPAWSRASPQQRIKRLRWLAERNDGIIFHQGPLFWPYDPFPELESDLLHARAGMWIQQQTPGFISVAFICSVEPVERVPFSQVRASFTRFVRHEQREQLHRERRARILTQTGFVVRPDVIKKVVAVLRDLPISGANIPAPPLAPFSTEALASYRDGGALVDVTVGQWRFDYNRQIARQFPRNATMLERSLQDLVTAEFDLREARRLGIDRTPQFIGNRRDFRHSQILNLFESEKLLPTIPVSAEEVQQRYDRDRGRLDEPTVARGLILDFPSFSAAMAWMQRHGHDARGDVATDSRKCVVSREQPLPGATRATAIILHMPDGRAFGPVPNPDGHASVFIKKSTIRVTPPLPQVVVRIRLAIARERLAALEQRLAPIWCRSFAVEDNIPYASLGISPSLARPWGRRDPKSAIPPGHPNEE